MEEWPPCETCGRTLDSSILSKSGSLAVVVEYCSRCRLKVALRRAGAFVQTLEVVVYRAKYCHGPSSRRIAIQADPRKTHFYRWGDLRAGIFDAWVSPIDQLDDDDYKIVIGVLKDPALILLWLKSHGYLRENRGSCPLYEEGVNQWDCIVKVDKNRYAVSGLNQTTDPYTQVIKLVDSQLRPVSTVTFRLPGRSFDKIEALIKVGTLGVLGVDGNREGHLLRYSKKFGLRIVQANIGIFPMEVRMTWIGASLHSRAVMGSDKGQVAIIKLTFH